MNQLEIEQFLDKLAQQTESDIEEVFNKRLQAILNQVARMYAKYETVGELSWTELNKYNRYQKEMAMIAKELTSDYRYIIKTIQQSLQYQYVEGYLRNMYLYEMTTSQAMGVSIPGIDLIKEIIANPIAELTLTKIFEQHRNEIVRKINIELAQAIQAGEGYAVMAKRLEKAVGFLQHKARTVVRTESGRVRSISGEKAEERARKYAEITGTWLSALDLRVRHAHRVLDGQETDDEGYFHYKGWKAKAPLLWGVASMDIQCRCQKLRKINGMHPEYRRGRNYMDPEYQHKLADRIEALMADRGLTYKQALKQAQKAIQPPSTTMKYVTYDDWYGKYAS